MIQAAIPRRVRVIKPDPEFMPVKEAMPEAAFQRLKALLGEAASQEMGSPVARMMARGEFRVGREAVNTSKSRYDAANWFFGLYYRNQKAIGAKGIAPQSLEPGSKSEPPDPFSAAGMTLSRKDKRATEEFRSARLSALAVGVEKYALFLAVVIEEQEPDYSMKQAVVLVSEALRRHRQLSSRHRQGRRA